MLTAKSKFCKIMVAVLSCIALALATFGFTTWKSASADDGEPSNWVALLEATSATGAKVKLDQSGTFEDTAYDYVMQLAPGEGFTIKLHGVDFAGNYLYEGIVSGQRVATSTNDAFTFVNNGEKGEYKFTSSETPAEGVVTLSLLDAVDGQSCGEVSVYVTTKNPTESAYEYNVIKMDSMTMMGPSMVHGTLSDASYGVNSGASNNVQSFRSNGPRVFFNNLLFNGLKVDEAKSQLNSNINIHVNGPSAVRDFALYNYLGDTATNNPYQTGDTYTFLKGFTLMKAGNAILTDANGKPFVFEATQIYRYDGSKFVAIKGVKSVSFENAEVYKEINETFTQAATVTLAAGAPETLDKTVTYKSNNTDVAEVNETTGEVKIKTFGEATITATSAEDKISGSYTVYVANPDAKPENAIIDNGNLFLVLGDYDFEEDDGSFVTGYTAKKSTENDIDFEVTINKVLYEGRALQLRVRYGVDGEYVNLYNAEALSGYRIAEGDYTFTTANEEVVSWAEGESGANAYQYLLNIVGEGTTTVTIKVWLPASDSAYTGFGVVAAHAYELGEITVKIIVNEEDVSKKFEFSGARAVKTSEILIDFKDFTIGSAADNSWNNTENFGGKANFPDWYQKITINGKTRDEWLAETSKNLNMHIRSEYLDFHQYTGTTECPFEDGDVITIEKGFRLLESLGGGDFQYYHENTKNYHILENTIMLKYDASAGATGAWTVISQVNGIEISNVTEQEPTAVENGAHVEMKVNDEVKLSALAVIDEAAQDVVDGTLAWTIADSTVATLTENEDGTYTVKLLKEAKTTITITPVKGTAVTLTVGTEPKAPEPDNPDQPDNPGNTGDNDNKEEPKKGGCSSNGFVTPVCAIAGILLVAGAVVIVKKSRKNS